MSPLEILSGPHTVHLFGTTLSLGPNGLAAIVGWALFAVGALLAVRERLGGRSIAALSPLVGAGATLAALAAGLGLLLADSYPTFARDFCFPYAVLALVATVLGRALHAAGSPIGEE